MLQKVLLFIIILLPYCAKAQKIQALLGRENSCADMLAISDIEHLIICDSLEWKGKDKDLNDEYALLKNSILEALSQRISVSVKSSSTSTIRSENVDVTHEEFSFVSTISSSNKLVEIDWEYCKSKSRKMIYARCTMNRKKSAHTLLSSCVTALKGLNSELSAILKKGAVAVTDEYEGKFSAIEHDRNSANFLYADLNTNEWDNALNDYYDLMTELRSSAAGGELSQRIEQANRYAINEKYPESIRSYRSILQTNQLSQVTELLKETEKKYFDYSKREADIQTAMENHTEAIKIWKTFNQLCAFPEAIEQLKECESRRFIQLERKFKAALQLEDNEDIDLRLLELKNLSHVYPDKYNSLNKEYKTYRTQKTEELIRIKLKLKKNTEAYQLVKDTESTLGYSQKLKDLRTQVESALVKEEIKREKKTRPMLNTFELGVDAFFKETSKNTEIFSAENTINTGVSAGLYFRYKIKNSPFFKGRTRADIVGLQARIIDLQNSISLYTDDSLSAQIPSDKFMLEVGPDITFLRVFRANINAVYKNIIDFASPHGISFNLGFLLPVGHLSAGANLRCMVDQSNAIVYNTNGYLRYRFDFHRKYSAADKRAARHRILD